MQRGSGATASPSQLSWPPSRKKLTCPAVATPCFERVVPGWRVCSLPRQRRESPGTGSSALAHRQPGLGGPNANKKRHLSCARISSQTHASPISRRSHKHRVPPHCCEPMSMTSGASSAKAELRLKKPDFARPQVCAAFPQAPTRPPLIKRRTVELCMGTCMALGSTLQPGCARLG